MAINSDDQRIRGVWKGFIEVPYNLIDLIRTGAAKTDDLAETGERCGI